MISLNDVKDWNLAKCNDELGAMMCCSSGSECINETRALLVINATQLGILSTGGISSNDAIRLLDDCGIPKFQDWKYGKTLYFIEDDHAIVVSGNDVSVVRC